MAVTDVREYKQGESGEIIPGDRNYTRVFHVTCAATDTIPAILTASSGGITIPVRGQTHPDDALAVCTHVGPCRALGDTRTQWEVPVRYARYKMGENADDDVRQPDPLDDPVRKSWNVRLVEEVISHDRDGNPIDNSAGAPFDPPLMEEVAILTVRITRNESTYNPAEAFSYANSVNATGCTIAGLPVGARQARCLGIPADNASRNGIDYWQVTYEFEFKILLWDRSVLDTGLYYLDAGEPKTFKDAENAPMQTPQLLDGAGGLGTVPTYLTFHTKNEKNFGVLGLGSV